MTPHVARCAEAVQHDDRWTMTANPDMDGCTVGFDPPRLHHSREGINPIYVGMLAHRCVILIFHVLFSTHHSVSFLILRCGRLMGRFHRAALVRWSHIGKG